MNKSSVVNQLKTIKDAILHGVPHYSMDGLVEENWLSWLFRNLWNLGNSHYNYQHYQVNSNQGIFRMVAEPQEEVSIALLSDWASDTPESHLVAAQCGRQDYSIHMGDTYYVGNEKEIAYNFSRENGSWPYGRLGSFAMLGNHEMYSSGKSYFTKLLPAMGSYQNDVVKEQQAASYFCLENNEWRIIGLDTGYDSLKGWLGLKPNLGLELHDEQKQWLKDVVKLGDPTDKRGIIILSHHQCFSAFEDEFIEPLTFLSSLIGSGRKLLWLCGHEHWCSVYGANPTPHGSLVYPRCIGNSGMPVELDKRNGAKVPKDTNPVAEANRKLVLYDNRKRETINGNIALGHNGYLLLRLQGENLNIDYYDDNDRKQAGRLVLSESWRIDITTGELMGVSITDYTQTGSSKLCHFISNINQAIN